MSGGTFDYNEGIIELISENIEEIIRRNGKKIPIFELRYRHGPKWKEWITVHPEDKYYPEYSDEVIEEFKKTVKLLRKNYKSVYFIDQLLSGDYNEETFIKKIEKINTNE